ncbi:MAG TPA: GNAT family N-acetyltransferase [Stellaceae bacterium]|nr:GNAT family N-acetyltransferase [Stellaceae bacterium]
MELETARLVLRHPLLADAPALLTFLGDADAMQYTFRLAALRACRRHLAAHDCQRRKLGFGPWTVLDEASGRAIGLGGLYNDPFDPGWGTEVAYHFARAAWGRGYATELTQFCVALAHGASQLPEVRAFAHPDNVASRRVRAKTGFVEQRLVPEMNRYLDTHRAG